MGLIRVTSIYPNDRANSEIGVFRIEDTSGPAELVSGHVQGIVDELNLGLPLLGVMSHHRWEGFEGVDDEGRRIMEAVFAEQREHEAQQEKRSGRARRPRIC